MCICVFYVCVLEHILHGYSSTIGFVTGILMFSGCLWVMTTRLRRYFPVLLRIVVNKVESKDLNWTNIQRIFALFTTVVTVAHICACTFFAVSTQTNLDSTCAPGSNFSDFEDHHRYFYPPGPSSASSSSPSTTSHSNHINVTDTTTTVNAVVNDDDSNIITTHWAELDNLVRLSCTVNLSANVTELVVSSFEPAHYQYFRALYWAVITMVTTGFGDIVPLNMDESIVAVAVVYIGLLLTLAMIANITSFITDLEENKSEHDKKLDLISTYLATHHGVPQQLKQNVRYYYQYKWEALHGFEPEREFQHFPYPIQAQVIGERSRRLLLKVDFLRQCPNRAFVTAVLETLMVEVVLPNDTIIKHATHQRDAFCLCQGECVNYDRHMRRTLQRLDGKDLSLIHI